MMQPTSGLIKKVNRAFILQAAFISIAALLSVFFARIVLEEILINQAIKEEADYFWEEYEKDNSFPLPDTLNLTGYFDTNRLPEAITEKLNTTTGFHSYEEDEYILYITEQSQKKLYLLYYRGQVDALVAYYGLVPLAFVLVLLYVSLWFTYRFSKRMVSPVSWLANRVNQIDFSSNKPVSLDLNESPIDSGDEIRVLADSIVNFGHRLDQFIERERNFTRDASHELRSPLTVIRIAADMLMSEQDLSPAPRNSVIKIKRAVDDMEDLTEAFLLLARESDNALSIDEVCINEVVKEELQRAEELNRDKQLPIEFIEQSRLCIKASDKVLSILLGNLIRNAILYTESGEITITLTERDFIIQDSGIGMEEDKLDMIFSPHYRGDNSSPVGYGVGLTIVKRLSDRFNWPLTVYSEPGIGTRIEVMFVSSN
jgi:signal transduction histidine kinase